MTENEKKELRLTGLLSRTNPSSLGPFILTLLPILKRIDLSTALVHRGKGPFKSKDDFWITPTITPLL